MGGTVPVGDAPIAEPAAGSIAARLDALPRAWPAWRLILLVSLGGCFEFYDLMMTAYISPGLVHAGMFHEGRAGLLGQSDQATFAASTFLGLFIGTAALARIADRFGRRTIFTASLVWYAAATLAMAASQSALQLILFRLVAGIGIGVELVTIDAYISEIAPARLRGRAFAINQAVQFMAVPARRLGLLAVAAADAVRRGRRLAVGDDHRRLRRGGRVGDRGAPAGISPRWPGAPGTSGGSGRHRPNASRADQPPTPACRLARRRRPRARPDGSPRPSRRPIASGR